MDDLFTYMERQTSAPPEGVPPGVATLFERLSMQVHHAGHERYSADAILHRIRWHMQIERGDREFCINNNWSSQLARWFLDQHPELTQPRGSLLNIFKMCMKEILKRSMWQLDYFGGILR